MAAAMTDILFTHSYFLKFDPKELRAAMPYPPLGTITAAAYLRSLGFSVALHDTMLSASEDELVPALAMHRPGLVAIYDDGFNYLTKMCLSRMREAAFRMAHLAKQAGAKVIVFSSDATDHLDEYFDHDVDYVICGEAEQTLAELAATLCRGTNPGVREIAGLAFREGERAVRTQGRGVEKNLDRFPVPAWDLVDVERYKNLWRQKHGYFSVNITTTRGCPFHCNWCAKPLYGQVYNSRSPGHVVEEMKFLKETVRPDHLWITDDIFGLKPGWIPAFDALVNQHEALIPFKCLSRVDLLLKEDTIRHLKNAGCVSVWVGAESGSQQVLDAMEKGTTVEQIYEASHLLHDAGIRVGFFLQFGYPGETWADIEKTLSMVHDCRPDEIGISVSYPLPGTPFYERVKSELIEKQNWVDSGDLDLMFTGAYSREFYRRLHVVVHKRASIWRGRHAMGGLLRNPFSMGRQRLRSIAASVYHGMTLPIELYRLRKERIVHEPA